MMETNEGLGGRPRDSFTDPHVVTIKDHEGNVIAKNCIYCGHRFGTKTSVTRIKAHLGRVPGQGVALCDKVTSTVQEAARYAMPGSSTSSRPSKIMHARPSTPYIPHHTHTLQSRPHPNLEFNLSALHQPQHTLETALQEIEHRLLSPPQDGENHFEHDMLTTAEVTHDGLSQFVYCDVSDDPEALEPAMNPLNCISIATQQTDQHQTLESFSFSPHLKDVQQEVLEVPLNTTQPNESHSMSGTLPSQHPMQHHLREDPNFFPYQCVLQDATRMDLVQAATISQNFLQKGGVCPNILPHSSYQGDMPITEFHNHEGLESQHHMQKNLQRDQMISSLNHDPDRSTIPHPHHMQIDPQLESLNAPTCTSYQDNHGRKRKLPNKGPIGKKFPLATTFQGLTFNKTVDEIYASLKDDSVSRIGVYGMGGIGKTTIMKHIHNLLVEEYPMAFSHVIWVTVSQDHTVSKLQGLLASRFDIILSHDGNEDARVTSLYEGMLNKRYALILDDVWDKVNLEQVGIPEPSHDNGCKLIVTTRSRDVCTRMLCKPISLDLLLEEEAWELFVKTLNFAPKNSIEEDIMRKVAKECARLPLAIVTVAGSMRGPFDVHEWRNAMDSLRKHTFGFTGMEKEVIEKLKFSYYRLGEQLQDCLLVCALFPEDYRINKHDLIELLISGGTISSVGSLLSAVDYGFSILNKLVNDCLLVQCFVDDEIVMHDLVRDMCLDIAGCRFYVKSCSEFSLNESGFTMDVERVSLIRSEFKEIPSHMVPECPKLSTLLLSDNMNLTRISHSFFVSLPNLQVLYLSYTSINELPNSITNLVSLNALVLQRCYGLKRLPCLASLKALKKLDLRGSKIEEAPEGLEELVHLTYLDLHGTNIRRLPKLIFQNMVKLQYLDIGGMEITIDDVKGLKNLETFGAMFATLKEFNEYVSSVLNCKQGPTVYDIGVSCGPISFSIMRYMDGTKGIYFGGNEDESRKEINCTEFLFPKDVESIIAPHELVETLDVENFGDNCVLSELVRVTSSSWHILPIRVHHEEKIEESDQSKGSFEAKLLLELSNLKRLSIRGCAFMEELISTSPSEEVSISSLEAIFIEKCDKFVRLLDPKFSSCFQNLEAICIYRCMSLESIISAANPIEKEESDNAISLSKLRHLILADLENLRSIYDGTFICPSIETIHVRRCPKLKRLPLQIPDLDNNSGRAVPLLSSLKVICGEQTWWESLEWDHAHAKTLLQPYFKPCLHRCYADIERWHYDATG